MRTYPLALALVALLAAQHAQAGRSGTSGSSGGRGSSISRSQSVARPAAPAYRPAASPSATRATPGARQLGARRSLLDDGPQPSAKLSQAIRERERSGPGWIGTGLLVYLLSQHDLSSSDRQWLESKLAALKAKDDDEAPALAPALSAAVQFHYDGLHPVFAVGQLAALRVSAVDRSGQALRVSCDLPQARIQDTPTSAAIQWQPAAASVIVLTCHAGGQRDRRILKAA